MITTNSSSIRVNLGSAITTSEMAITGHYVTMNVSGVVSNVVQINMLTNGVTAVEVVPSSSVGGVVNVLKNLQIANVDTLANQVIIEQWDGLTAKSLCPAISLDVTQAIQINSDGDLTIIPVAGGGGGSGTVTSVHGTGTVSGITLTGTVTTSGNLTLGGTLAVTPSNFSSQSANTFLAAPNGAAGVPNFRAMVAADVPTLNQNTTGNAATVTTNANLTGDVTSVGNTTTYAGTVPVNKGGTGHDGAGGLGWTPLGACTYETADSPTFQFSIASDVTGFIGVGHRIKLTQTTVKYFIVTAVGVYSGGKTIITIFGGTDYTLANAAISSPYYSNVKAPIGFPLDPAKWTVTLNDTTARSQASPAANTVYNLGSLSISMPIGCWDVQASISGYSVANASTAALDFICGLSTSASSFSNNNLKGKHQLNSALNSNALVNTISILGTITVTVKTTYYVVESTTATTVSSIGLVNSQIPLNIYFMCAYL